MDQYVLGTDGRTPIRCDNFEMWCRERGRRRDEGDPWRVGLTKLPNGIEVSTVFLGLDHAWGDGPPMLFETMVFGGSNDEYCERYSTWDEAEAGHKESCRDCNRTRLKRFGNQGVSDITYDAAAAHLTGERSNETTWKKTHAEVTPISRGEWY